MLVWPVVVWQDNGLVHGADTRLLWHSWRDKSGAGGGQEGAMAAGQPSMYFFKKNSTDVAVGRLGTREWAVGCCCLAGVYSTIFCTRPIGHVVQCETGNICFLGTNFDLIILIGSYDVLDLGASIWLHLATLSFDPWPSRLGVADPVLVNLFKWAWQFYTLYVHECEWNVTCILV
jgi:hypothetical protein